MKKLLVIAFHFPPDNSSGMLRTSKFVTHLPEFGWWPTIVSAPERLYAASDPELLRRLPEAIRVMRPSCFDTKEVFSIRGRYPGFLAVPDRYASWIPGAVRRGSEFIRQAGADAIFSTSPIPSAHLISLLLKRRFGLPWLADFRDPWAVPHQVGRRNSIRFKFERFLERQVIRKADRVVAVTETMSEDLRSRYTNEPAGKFVSIYNGFDETDFEGLETYRRTEGAPVTILHAGTVYSKFRDPRPLLEAMRACFTRGSIPRDRLFLRLVGGGAFVESETFRSTLESLDLVANVEILDRVSHREALAMVTASDVLLLMQYTRELRAQLPAKVFEYARAGKPILALTAPGETETFIRRFDLGVTIHPDETERLERCLEDLYRQTTERPPQVRQPEGIEAFERRALTEQLVRVLDRQLEQVRRPGALS